MRALSAGPVGIGDKLSFIDKRTIERLTLPDGRLAKPDRPPWPLVDPLNKEIMVAQTETAVGGLQWRYLLLANVGERPADFRLDTRELFPNEEFITYDCLNGRLTEREQLGGGLEPTGASCHMLAPRRWLGAARVSTLLYPPAAWADGGAEA